MRILVAVDDGVLLTSIAEALEAQGHEVTSLRDGFQALASCRKHPPDLLLTAFRLAGIEGLELARLLRLVAQRHFVPILMFTDGAPQDYVGHCLEAGVMEFISCPFDAAELRCRVATIARLVRLQQDLLTSQAFADEELAAVKHMLARLVHSESPHATPGFHMETLQTQRINGDACVYRESIPGVHFGLICDATGHGLMAGVSTIPVVETFLSMVRRDFPLRTIYMEIHAKLTRLLPTGRFACLLLMRVDVAQGVLSVLNAGMPPVHLLREGGAIQTFPSRVLPAGIEGADPGVAVTETGIAAGDRILAFSDGLGDLVPTEDLVNLYLLAPARLTHQGHCAAIRQRVHEAARHEAHEDDVSWALWEVPGPTVQVRGRDAGPGPERELVSGFEASFRLDPREHSPREVIPHVLSLLTDFQISQSKAQLFGMLLTEALTNAVEHGVLELQSSIKAQGFEAYEQHRQLALARLASGSVRCTITCFHEKGTKPSAIRRIRAEVEDTGPGFQWRPWLQDQAEDGSRPFGRGIALLAGLGQELSFNEKGNSLSFYLECP